MPRNIISLKDSEGAQGGNQKGSGKIDVNSPLLLYGVRSLYGVSSGVELVHPSPDKISLEEAPV